MRKLIETEEFIKAAKLDRFGGTGTARILMMLLRINKINKLYSDIAHLNGIDFIDKLIEELKISFEISEEALNRIP